jgi:hypothetical protein
MAYEIPCSLYLFKRGMPHHQQGLPGLIHLTLVTLRSISDWRGVLPHFSAVKATAFVPIFVPRPTSAVR